MGGVGLLATDPRKLPAGAEQLLKKELYLWEIVRTLRQRYGVGKIIMILLDVSPLGYISREAYQTTLEQDGGVHSAVAVWPVRISEGPTAAHPVV